LWFCCNSDGQLALAARTAPISAFAVQHSINQHRANRAARGNWQAFRARGVQPKTSQIREQLMKIRPSLLLAVGPIALALSLAATPTFAQDRQLTASDPDEDSTILVTGSRIARPQADTAAPVVTVVAEEIERSGKTNISELLSQTPALIRLEGSFSAAGTQARNGGAGVNLLNLRGLGANRTLVLVDGRRHVAGISGEVAVDTTTIPLALIERVDVLTGGVSPIYGADGVSGVVNFVMRRDFEGTDLRAQTGISDFGDAQSVLVAGTIGQNFANDRANIAVSYEYRRDEPVSYGDRPNGRPDAYLLVRNLHDIPDDPNVPDRVFRNFVGYSDSSPAGAVAIDTSLLPYFLGGGEPFDPGTLLPDSGALALGGDNTPTAGYKGDLQARTEHHAVNAFLNYQLTPSVRFFAEGKYVSSENFTVSQPSFDQYTYVPADNPFIPAAIAGAIAPGNFAAFGLADGVAFNRDNFDFGTWDETLNRDLYRSVVGLDGDIGESAKFEFSYVFGQNDTRYTNDDNRIADRYFAALDAVDEGAYLTGTPNGNIVCRSDLNGGAIETLNIADYFGGGALPTAQTFTPGDGSCAPLNIFGEGVASQEALDFVLVDLHNEYTVTQYVVNGFVSGDLGSHFELPGGPVGYAIGGEFRQEKSVFTPDPIAKQTVQGDPNTGVLADAALLTDERGEFHVWEAFAEVSLPLLADMPLADLFEVGAAIRLSDYSAVGSTTSWSVNGQYAPVRDLRLRATYSQNVRAPNIAELFAPRSGIFNPLSDPCGRSNINNGTEFRQANCAALLGGLGIDPTQFTGQTSGLIEGIGSGNDQLKEEQAETWTAGAVFQPRFLRGLTLSADWFDIRLTDAVNTASLNQTAQFCVDAPTLDNAFCDNITRNPRTGLVTGYTLRPENVAFIETAGADFTVAYGFDLSGGRLGSVNLRGTLGYLDKLLYLPANGGVVDDERGETGSPIWNGTADVTWDMENVSLNYGVQFIGEQLRFEHAEIAANPDIADPDVITLDSRFLHDIRAEYRTDDSRLGVFVGVNNFTNEMPARGSINAQTGWLGRYFYLGIRLRSDELGF
jgi:outer membrane receptor protein involved in Fe transport